MTHKVKTNKVKQVVEKYADDLILQVKKRPNKNIEINIHNEVRIAFNHKESMLDIVVRLTVGSKEFTRTYVHVKEMSIVMNKGAVDLVKPLDVLNSFVKEIHERYDSGAYLD